jgi:hypothetical protein
MRQRKNIEKFFCFWDDSYLMLCRKDGFFWYGAYDQELAIVQIAKKVRVDP